jgi:hypothetical protein
MDAADILDSLDTLIYSIASRCVVHVDGFTLGTHPEPEPREAGELALLDWNQTGGPLVAETDRAIPELVDRVGWARALGAALAALEKSDDAELDVLHDLITGARWIEETRPGGPADPELRLALATRCAALSAMGNPGEITDKVAKRRPVHTDVLMLDPYEFRIYTVLAHLPLCDADRAALAVSDVAAAPAVPPVLVVALERTLERAGWQILAVDIDMSSETARIELRRGELFVTFDARNGKASTTRERQEIRTYKAGRKGDIYRAERVHMHFIGRARHDNARDGLSWLAGYLADNSAGALTVGEAQAMLAPMVAA